MLTKLSLVVVVLSGLGCASTQANFQPRSAASDHAVLTAHAIRIYEADADAIAAAGGDVLGTAHVEGNAYADGTDVRARSEVYAAACGGTHVMLGSARLRQLIADRPGVATTRRTWGGALETTYTPPATVSVGSEVVADYIVFRVPPEKWETLPLPLRPAPLAQAPAR